MQLRLMHGVFSNANSIYLKRPRIDHYAFPVSVIVLVYMIARFIVFHNAHSAQCILVKTGSSIIFPRMSLFAS